MLALAHDYRIMREDKGWICLPAVNIQLVLPRGLLDLAKCKLSPAVFRDAVLSGKRYSGPEALSAAIVDSVCSEDQLLSKAKELGSSLMSSKDTQTYGGLKQRMFADVIQQLRHPNDLAHFHVNRPRL